MDFCMPSVRICLGGRREKADCLFKLNKYFPGCFRNIVDCSYFFLILFKTVIACLLTGRDLTAIINTAPTSTETGRTEKAGVFIPN